MSFQNLYLFSQNSVICPGIRGKHPPEGIIYPGIQYNTIHGKHPLASQELSGRAATVTTLTTRVGLFSPMRPMMTQLWLLY